MGIPSSRISINSAKIPIHVRPEYVASRHPRVRDNLRALGSHACYRLGVDKHVHVDGNLVLAVECKAYTELAMLKRILVDFNLLKTRLPDLSCMLIQFENFMGGDYGTTTTDAAGSPAAHAVMSYFPNVDLNIATLLRGDRQVDRPITQFFKPLLEHSLHDASTCIETLVSAKILRRNNTR